MGPKFGYNMKYVDKTYLSQSFGEVTFLVRLLLTKKHHNSGIQTPLPARIGSNGQISCHFSSKI